MLSDLWSIDSVDGRTMRPLPDVKKVSQRRTAYTCCLPRKVRSSLKSHFNIPINNIIFVDELKKSMGHELKALTKAKTFCNWSLIYALSSLEKTCRNQSGNFHISGPKTQNRIRLLSEPRFSMGRLNLISHV